MARYSHDYEAFGRLVLNSEEMGREMARRARKVKARAEATAPDAPPLGEGYRDEFEVVELSRIAPTRRRVARVVNDSEHAVFVEFGGRNTPRHRTLGKALDAAGD